MSRQPVSTGGFSLRYIGTVIAIMLLSIAMKRWPDNKLILYGFMICTPAAFGFLAKFLIVRVDALYEPNKDFPVWFYYVMWALMGVILYAVYGWLLPDQFVWKPAVILVFTVLYIAGLANPFIKIQPAHQRKDD